MSWKDDSLARMRDGSHRHHSAVVHNVWRIGYIGKFVKRRWSAVRSVRYDRGRGRGNHRGRTVNTTFAIVRSRWLLLEDPRRSRWTDARIVGDSWRVACFYRARTDLGSWWRGEHLARRRSMVSHRLLR